jgi:hypothetical protein
MEAFLPIGNTVDFAVTGTTASAQLRIPMPVQPSVVRLANIGTQTVFIAFGDSTVTATVADGFPMIANSVECISMPSTATHVAAIASGTGSTLYATVGEGV